MDISSVNSDLIRGNVTTIILGSLWSQDRYGYDILKEIETKSEGQYKLKQPTLYNQLKRLEKQGLISSYDGDPDDTGGGRRRYYSLTAEGRNFLQKENPNTSIPVPFSTNSYLLSNSISIKAPPLSIRTTCALTPKRITPKRKSSTRKRKSRKSFLSKRKFILTPTATR